MMMHLFDRYQDSLAGLESVRLGVAVALLDENQRLLLELRSDVKMWGITGGRLDIGESPEECGCREVFEETGISLSPQDLSLFGVYGDIKDRRVLQYPEIRVQLVDVIYTATVSSSLPLILSNESLQLKYFESIAIPSAIVPPAIRPIKDLQSRGLVR